MKDLIRAFKYIAHYGLRLRSGSNGKSPNFASLECKIVAMCGDSKLLADAIKYYLEVKDLNTKDCALKGSKLFGSTKRKLGIPQGAYWEVHQLDHLNHLIPCPKLRV